MRGITTTNTHQNGAKGGGGYGPHGPKFGGWWWSVRRTGRKEVRDEWTGFVTRTKKNDKNKKN